MQRFPENESRLPGTDTTIFTKISRLAQQHNAVNLGQGFPDFPVAADLIEAVHSAMRNGHNQYAPMAGYPPLLERIAERLQSRYSSVIDPQRMITVTCGATEAIFAAIVALVRPGDEVVLFEPAYDSYEPAIRVAGGKPVHVPLTFPNYAIPWDVVHDRISPKTRLIIINSPHNPSGAVITEADLKELETIANARGIFVLSDEVYEHLVFDGRDHQSILSRPALLERGVAVFSFGKTFHATGWKIGYAVASAAISGELRKLHQFMTFSVNAPAQAAIADYMKRPDVLLQIGDFFQDKRDQFLALIRDSGWEPLRCCGTYFQLLAYGTRSAEPDSALAERLIRDFKVASVPVSALYHDQTDHHVLRFCFAKKDETLVAAAKNLQAVWH